MEQQSETQEHAPPLQEAVLTQQIELDQGIKVKRIDATFEIGEDATNSYLSPPINGTLKSLLLDLEGQTTVRVFLHDTIPIQIFEKVLNGGYHYLPIQTEAIAPNGDKLNFVGHEYLMVDGVEIRVYGSKGNKVSLIIYYV